VGVGAAFPSAAGSVQAAQAVGSAVLVGMAGIVPPGSALVGALPGTTVLHVDLVLQPKDPAALARYAAEVSTPGSPLYHAYIPRGQFAAMFGPSGATISGVYAALRARGLRPGAISADHLSIPVTAAATQIESAFGVGMARYRLAGAGTGYANTSAPALPAALAAHVQAVVGLDNLARMQPLATKPVQPQATRPTTSKTATTVGEPTGGPQPCSGASAEQSNGGLTADELAYSYEFSPLYESSDFGAGVTVGIVEFGEPNLPSDIAAYQSCYGTSAQVSYHQVDGFKQTGAGEGEAALDIEVVAGLAPGASIVVYQAPNTGAAPYDVYRTIVDRDTARVISESYGLCEFYQDRHAALALHTLLEQAAVQGQTVVASSGDTGSEGCLDNDSVPRRLSVSFPASDPLVLGVGGTTLSTVQPRPGEAVWNERSSGNGAGGGGKSTLFAEPKFQASFGIKSKVRQVPDVSADADPLTGYVVYHSGAWVHFGGTSGSAPLWAALLALTDAKCPTSPVGWVNPALYHAASPAAKTIVLDDISTVSGSLNNNDYTGAGHGNYPVGKGYDMATGLGSPIGGALATQLCKAGAQPHGYWLVTADGHVYAFGVPSYGSVASPNSPVVGIAGDRQTGGYWVVTAKGKVYAFHAPGRGSAHSASPIVGIAPDKAGSGYWLVSARGQVFAFHAKSLGSVTNPGSKVVGIALDQQTGGYWVVTAKGRVFAFDAGSYPGENLSDVTGIAGDQKRQGYWLVTASGKVYAFGVHGFGDMPFSKVGKTIGIACDPASGGYWLVTANGHVAGLSAVWHGDEPGTTSQVAGIASSR
jgi:subtilase family serine protease